MLPVCGKNKLVALSSTVISRFRGQQGYSNTPQPVFVSWDIWISRYTSQIRSGNLTRKTPENTRFWNVFMLGFIIAHSLPHGVCHKFKIASTYKFCNKSKIICFCHLCGRFSSSYWFYFVCFMSQFLQLKLIF